MTDLIPRDAAIEEAFMDAVWDALKADATDLGKQQRILTAVRAIPAIDPAAIREAALRDAALRIGGMIRGYDKTEYEEGYNDALATAERYILALIGEKK